VIGDVQQGQVFELPSKGFDGERLWAYRFRVSGRGAHLLTRLLDVDLKARHRIAEYTGSVHPGEVVLI